MSNLVAQLRIEANATEELHPGDSEIEVMRNAASEIERLTERCDQALRELGEARAEVAHLGECVDELKEQHIWALNELAPALERANEAESARDAALRSNAETEESPLACRSLNEKYATACDNYRTTTAELRGALEIADKAMTRDFCGWGDELNAIRNALASSSTTKGNSDEK